MKTRTPSRHTPALRGLFAALPLCAIVIGCERDSPASFDAITVTVTSPAQRVNAGDTLQLSAAVTSASDRSVTWQVLEGEDGGVVTSSGLYIAPVIADDSMVVTVQARSVERTSSVGTTAITVLRHLPEHQVPGVGSTFHSQFYEIDTAGKKVAGSERSFTTTVEATGQSLNGRDGVARLVRSGDSVEYMSFDASGDVWIPVPAGTSWRRLPFGTRERVLYDSSASPGNGGTIVKTRAARYLGLEIVPIDGRKTLTQKVRVEYLEEKDGPTWYKVGWYEDYWYSPELGLIVRYSRTSYLNDYEGDSFSFGALEWVDSYERR